MTAPYASPVIRDEFLAALDAGDAKSCMRLALQITACGNPLPGLTCQALGLQPGSTYGNAAAHVLAHNGEAFLHVPETAVETAGRDPAP